MAMGSGGGIRAAVAEINVTPLIDVLLVLLIIFMVIVPVTPKGLDTLVPQPPKNAQPQPESPRTIVIQVLSSRTGPPTYRINDETLAVSALQSRLAAIFATRQEKVMFIQGDPDLLYQNIAEVVDFGHQAGVDHIGILTPARLVAQ